MRSFGLTDINGNTYASSRVVVYGPDGKIKFSGGGGGGTVTSVGLTMPSAFNVAGSPVTTAGTLAVTGAGLVSQYIRGDGTLANFPTSTGGGASVNYYLNGSINQGVFSGNTYYEMNKVPVIGLGTNFSIATNGYISQFITDANDPSQLNIPAGNWTFEMYFNASSGGGSPNFYVELYKWDGVTFTLIASSSTNPEGITNGTAVDLYVTALAVPATVLALTDRLAVRVYVNNSGRTITLHTEDNNLCQIITTFTTGLTALNGLTEQVQTLTTGTTGTDFNISSAVATHTFNLPVASALNTGKLSAADWITFNNKGTVTSVDITPGPGISVSGSPITGSGSITVTNTAPDQTVTITAGSNISVSGTYPNFTVAYTGTLPQIWTSFNEVNLPIGSVGVNNLASITIPANTFQNGDGILVRQRLRRNTGTNSTCSMGIYVNNANTLVGATLLATTTLATTNPIGQMKRDFFVRGATTNGYINSSNIASDDILTTVQGQNYTINWTVTQYLFFTANPASASDSFIFLGYYVMRIRP